MLTRITNERGAVSVDENIISDMLKEALLPFSGKVWIADYRGRASDWALKFGNIGGLAEKEIYMTSGGVFVRVYLVVSFGTSIAAVTSALFERLERGIGVQLELPIADIEVKVTGILTPKKRIIRRSITVSLKGGRHEF